MSIVQDSLELVKIAGQIANPELVERVMKLNAQVIDLSAQNLEFQQRMFQLESELQRSQDKLKLIGEVERRGGFIYRKDATEPCCSRCFDVDRKLVHIVVTRTRDMGIHATCPECKTACGIWPQGLAAHS